MSNNDNSKGRIGPQHGFKGRPRKYVPPRSGRGMVPRDLGDRFTIVPSRVTRTRNAL